MKTGFYVATVAATLLTCGLANAQVLGGSGGLTGGLGGGLRQPGGMLHGSAQGAFDASGVRRSAADVGSRAARRSVGAAQSVGGRARGVLDSASATGRGSAAAAVSHTQSAATSASAAGSLTSETRVLAERTAAQPMPAAPATEVAPAPQPQLLDVAASKQHAINANSAGREVQASGSGNGSLTGNLTQQGVGVGAQGSGAMGASVQKQQQAAPTQE